MYFLSPSKKESTMRGCVSMRGVARSLVACSLAKKKVAKKTRARSCAVYEVKRAL